MFKQVIYKIIHFILNFFCTQKKIIVTKKMYSQKSAPKIIIALTPEYGNMGDQLIAYAEINWLKKYFSDYEIVEYTQTELEVDKKLSVFKAAINDNDIIFFQGGGNLNDMYLKAEGIRRKIISDFPNNKIVIFPQSISFGCSPESIQIKNQTSKIYSSHKNLTICARDTTSYDIAKQIFPKNKVMLFPDMAISLIGSFNINKNRENKIALCFRDDREKLYSDRELECAVSSLKDNYVCEKIDTHVGHIVTKSERDTEITKMIKLFSSYRLVITDRFHGIIYSAIAGTPCIALKSTDHKIIDGIKWLESYKNIRYSEPFEIPSVAESLLYNETDENFNPDEYFLQMSKKIIDDNFFQQ